jgi:hypothetical protein
MRRLVGGASRPAAATGKKVGQESNVAMPEPKQSNFNFARGFGRAALSPAQAEPAKE